MANLSLSRRIAWVAVFVAMVAALTIANVDNHAETSVERIQRLSASYACPTCSGQTAADSNAAAAATVRDFIRTRVEQGATDDQIRDELIRAYGGEIMLTPPGEGISLLVWVLPVLAAAGGAIAVAASLRRSPPQGRHASDDDRALVARELAQIAAAQASRSSEGHEADDPSGRDRRDRPVGTDDIPIAPPVVDTLAAEEFTADELGAEEPGAGQSGGTSADRSRSTINGSDPTALDHGDTHG